MVPGVQTPDSSKFRENSLQKKAWSFSAWSGDVLMVPQFSSCVAGNHTRSVAWLLKRLEDWIFTQITSF